MLENLSSSAYQSGTVNTAFLLHSVGHMPRGREIDASIMYADYYYIEALLRLRTVIKVDDLLLRPLHVPLSKSGNVLMSF